MTENKQKRLTSLEKIPLLGRVDHRCYLDDEGKLPFLSQMTRNERRQQKKIVNSIVEKYNNILRKIFQSGAKFPVDQFLRERAIEYTHRYASSGTMTQPTSFNYFEAFYTIKLIKSNIAPYVELTDEINHLFSVTDFFDYLTEPKRGSFDIASLSDLAENTTYHFTTNGSLFDLTFLNESGKEFIVSGFSMIKRGNSLHWYLIGGEVLSKEEWSSLCSNSTYIDVENIPLEKQLFMKDVLEKSNSETGKPISLEGADTAVRTVIMGEFDFIVKKHLGRCYMSERENLFLTFTDDPEMFEYLNDKLKQKNIMKNMLNSIQNSSVLWDLAESFFQLPVYFSHKEIIDKEVINRIGKKQSFKTKGGRGINLTYKVISSVSVVDKNAPHIRTVIPPHYKVETEGHWRRLKNRNSEGKDREGNKVFGRTWVKSQSKWRERNNGKTTVFVKNPISIAKLKIKECIEAAEKRSDHLKELECGSKKDDIGELYVLRCLIMEQDTYKVGWTSKKAHLRAEELSSATGVPSAFVVVKFWKHLDAAALEKEVHVMLDPYRISNDREFFKVKLEIIENIVNEIIQKNN